MGLNFGRQGLGNPRRKVDFKEGDFYKYYKQNAKTPVSRQVFAQFSKKLGNGIIRLVTFDGVEVIFPWRVGTLYLKRRETKVYFDDVGNVDKHFMRVDWNKTLKHWDKVYEGKSMEEVKGIKDKKYFFHLNEHSDGFKYRWYWDRVTSNVKNQSFYNFRPIRKIKRELTDFIRITGNKVKYYE
jgi:hypothetical protein